MMFSLSPSPEGDANSDATHFYTPFSMTPLQFSPEPVQSPQSPTPSFLSLGPFASPSRDVPTSMLVPPEGFMPLPPEGSFSSPEELRDSIQSFAAQHGYAFCKIQTTKINKGLRSSTV
jgi:hypothetical protein